ncbi:MAG: peptidoglycan DD-metalloendopeptidase family protein [Oscillibacter sp.]
MKKRNGTIKRLGRSLLVLLLAMTLVTSSLSPALALSQADIDALKNDAGDLAGQKKELEKQLAALADDKKQALQRKKLLDQQINVLASQIGNVEQQISNYAALIVQTEAELADAEAREAAQYELFCQRVRAMEERGTISYWSILFQAESFTDLLSNLDFINEIMDSDQAVIDELQALQEEIQTKKDSLVQSKADSEALKAELMPKKAELDTQRAAANKLVREIEDNQSDYEETLADIEAEEEAIQARIVKLSKELAAQSAGPAALGGYIWPVNSRRITSTFGGRASPGGIGSTNHKGVDIGGVGYSSEIFAAKGGTVIVSQYSSSYGNYVVVAHGGGNTTLYAHMSSRKVASGQVVKQGAVLGITGSTGHSTGPHLHFEITENGVRINPLNPPGYLNGYKLSR